MASLGAEHCGFLAEGAACHSPCVGGACCIVLHPCSYAKADNLWHELHAACQSQEKPNELLQVAEEQLLSLEQQMMFGQSCVSNQ